TLDKNAYNEALVFVYTMVLGLLQEKMDGLTDKGIDDHNDRHYFVDMAKLAVNNGNGITSSSEGWNASRSLGANQDNYIEGVFNKLRNAKTTEARVDILEPLVRSLPTAMTKWVLDDVVEKMVGMAAFGAASLAANGVVANISKLLATILPIPFAQQGAPDPTLAIYIDINPDTAVYGYSGSSYKMHSGVQAVELYINSSKTEAGTVVNTYTNHGVKQNQNNMGKTYGNNAGVVKVTSLDNVTSGDQFFSNTQYSNGWDYFVLRINPYDNDGSGSNNDPMIGFMQADKVEETTLRGQVASPPAKIVVTDIATRQATADGKAIVLNEKYLEDPAYFPQKAKVTWANGTGKGYDTVGDTTAGSANYLGGTTIIWDASTIDFSAAELTSNGEYLAGHVYG
ncbi:MAG: hypothetical protein IKD35_03410, partial [Clostridia bacterium]|nr:hypothetical protein [Clostridia bacterium]